MKISIIGDSISSFEGWTPSGYINYYPKEYYGVTSVNDTWWHKVIGSYSATLEVNASFSGGAATEGVVSEIARPDFYVRANTQTIGQPEIVFVALGTNDSLYRRTIGDAYHYDESIENLSESEFCDAYIKGIKALQTISSIKKIVCVILNMEDVYANAIKNIANHYSLHYVDCRGYDTPSNDDPHPTNDGMLQISNKIINSGIMKDCFCFKSNGSLDDKVNCVGAIRFAVKSVEGNPTNQQKAINCGQLSSCRIIASAGHTFKVNNASGTSYSDYILDHTSYISIYCENEDYEIDILTDYKQASIMGISNSDNADKIWSIKDLSQLNYFGSLSYINTTMVSSGGLFSPKVDMPITNLVVGSTNKTSYGGIDLEAVCKHCSSITIIGVVGYHGNKGSIVELAKIPVIEVIRGQQSNLYGDIDDYAQAAVHLGRTTGRMRFRVANAYVTDEGHRVDSAYLISKGGTEIIDVNFNSSVQGGYTKSYL